MNSLKPCEGRFGGSEGSEGRVGADDVGEDVACVSSLVSLVCVCVCVCGVAEHPATKSFSVAAGGPSVCCVRWSNEAATANADIEADHLDVPATFGVGDVKSFWPVVSLAVCASC